jgi:glycine/D-amino acid oxidase-like deaminating enzyme
VSADVLVLGHGIAGAVVAWTLTRAGLAVEVADAGSATSASRVGAGLINPVTGRRLVPSWRVREALPLARRVYGEMAAAWGVPLWHELRVRRLYADEGERTTARERWERGEFAPFVVSIDDHGCWFQHAARVDVAALLAGSETHWRRCGAWLEANLTPEAALARARWVLDCRGLAAACDPLWSFLPWRFAAGELLELECAGLEPDVVINRRQWLLPVGGDRAWAGATQEPEVRVAAVTAAGRDRLSGAVAALTSQPFHVTGQRAGVRVALPDRRPVVGWHPSVARIGLINGLGSKGALYAPWLAAVWAEELIAGKALPDELSLTRGEI